MSAEELLPAWAVEITKQVAILNEKIPNHIDWVERNVKDHEARIRLIETQRVSKTEHDLLAEKVDRLESKADQSAWAGRLGWLLIGAGIAAIVTVAITQYLNR